MRAPELPTIDHEVTRFIVENLRPEDRREIDAVSRDESDDARIERYMMLAEFTFWAEWGERPAGLIGAWPLWPGIWQVYAFGTEDFERVAPTLTKFAKRFMTPALIRAGAHRAQCDSIADHHRAHRWLESMGYENEGAMRKYGRGGETFYRFAYVTEG